MPKISEGHRAEVRGRILEAARHLVAHRGVQGTSMNDIVRASGLSKGAIYGHFPSKADLVVALQDRVLEGRLMETALRFQAGEPARERIRKLVSLLFERGAASDREKARLNLQFIASALHSPRLRSQVDARYDRVHRLFRDLIAEGQRSGEFRGNLDPAATATAVIAVLDGLAVDWAFTSEGRFDSERLLPTLEGLLFEGLLNRGEPSSRIRFDRSQRGGRRSRADPSNAHKPRTDPS